MPVEFNQQPNFQAIAAPKTGYALNQFDWSVVVPEGTQNLFVNPSFESSNLDFVDFYSSTSSMSRLTSAGLPDNIKPIFGRYVIKVTPGDSISAINLQLLSPRNLSFDKLTFSIYFLGKQGELFALSNSFFQDTNPKKTDQNFTATGQWQRVSITLPVTSLLFTGNTKSNAGWAFYVIKKTFSLNPFYVDSFQAEPKPYVTTYCDGNMPGCRWSGPPNSSASQRPDNNQGGGGREYRLADLGFKVTTINGHDSPLYGAQVQQYGLAGGQNYERTVAKSQQIVLSNVIEGNRYPVARAAKDKIVELLSPYSSQYADRQLILRGKLVDDCLANNPRQVGPTLEMPCRVAGDLTGSNDNYNQERFAIAFVNDNPPAVRAVYESSTTLNPSNVITGVTGNMTYFKPVLTQPSFYVTTLNTWQTPDRTKGSPGLGFQLTAIATSKIVTPFPTVSISPTFGAKIESGSGSVVALPDGQTPVATGLTSPNALAFDQNNVLYIGSNTAANYVQKYNGALSVMGTTNVPNAQVRALVVVPYTDVLLAFGDFTNSGTRWGRIATGGTTWVNPTGGAGFNNIVRGAILLQNGKVLIYGDFTSADGVAYNRVVLYDPYTLIFSAVGKGFSNGSVRSAVQLPNGDIVFGGTFTTTGAGLTTNYVAIYNGSQILPLGNNVLGGQVNSVAYFEGFVYAAGFYNTVPDAVGRSQLCYGLVMLAGDYWVTPDILTLFDGTTVGGTFVGAAGGALYASTSASLGSAFAAAVNNVTYEGTADAYPTIVLRATSQSTVFSIVNQATKAAIYFNNLIIAANEIITINCAPTGMTAISNLYGDVSRFIMPNSDFSRFALVKRNTSEASAADYSNPIQVLAGLTGTIELYWRNTFQGFSATATAAFNGL